MDRPPLPRKLNDYAIKRGRVYANPKLQDRYKVESYIGGHKKLYVCDNKLFYNYNDARECCQFANKPRISEDRQIDCSSRDSYAFDRNSISRSNRKKNILVPVNSPKGRKYSFSGSRNSLSGSSRSSSRESLTNWDGDSSLGKNSMSGSNTNLSPSSKFMSKSSGDLLYGRDSTSRSSFDQAKRRNSLSKSSIDLLERRNSSTKSKETLNNNEINDKNKEEAVDEHFSKKTTSFQVWYKIWELCSFKCYSKNHYDRYKLLMLKEINTYRSMHGVEHLVTTQQLTELAQVLADKYAMRQTLEIHKHFAYGVLYTYVKVFSASVIMGNLKSKTAKNFAQLIWKSTNQIGIGVQDEDGFLYVVCVFFPKGNEKGKYKKNILKRKS